MTAPLHHRRILVTRPRGQSSRLADLLTAEGATPILIPTIELAPPASFCALDAAITTILTFDWVIFTSANAVDAALNRARTLNLPFYPRRIAAIGPATAKALQPAGLEASLVPTQYVAESLLDALLHHARGASMLLIRAAVARDLLPESLAEAGAQVTIAEAYRTVIPAESVAHLRQLFASEPPDAITFTSASTAQNLAALLATDQMSIPDGTILASIGPVTSQAMQQLGFTPTVEARESTLESLVEALMGYTQHKAG